jgi:hypothetical protein
MPASGLSLAVILERARARYGAGETTLAVKSILPTQACRKTGLSRRTSKIAVAKSLHM